MSKFAVVWRESTPSRHVLYTAVDPPPDLSQDPAYCVKARYLKSEKIAVPSCLGLRQLLPNLFGAYPIHAPELGVGRSMAMHLPSEQPSFCLDMCLYGSHPSLILATMILSTLPPGLGLAHGLTS
jgi:hypothetical protein